jgi:hypothetical protein
LPLVRPHAILFTTKKETRMPLCDGCGAQVDDTHIRQRIERLEFATRYRPVHIALLLIDGGPSSRPEDYFYRAAAEGGERSPESKTYFDALARAAGIDSKTHQNEEAVLTEFQRRGFFLVGAVDCPRANSAAIERNSSTLLRRVKVSYQPKSIALISPLTEVLIPHFQQASPSIALILSDGKPFDFPAQAETLAKELAKAGASKAQA